jgi:hypothetical protein
MAGMFVESDFVWMVTAPSGDVSILIGSGDDAIAIWQMGERISGLPQHAHGMSADTPWLVVRSLADIHRKNLYGINDLFVPPGVSVIGLCKQRVARDLYAPAHWLRMGERNRILRVAGGRCTCGATLDTINDGHPPVPTLAEGPQIP